MVKDVCIQCDACKTNINLRIQFGYYDIPFYIRCPKCKSTIHGKVVLKDPDNLRLDIENAIPIKCNDSEFYSVELSAEFPTKKPFYKKKSDMDLTSYIRSFAFFGDGEKTNEEIRKAMYFANFIQSGLSEMKQNYELFWNSQDDILFPRLMDKLKQYPGLTPISEVKTRLDAAMTLHQLLLTTTGIPFVIGNKALTEYMGIAEKIVEGQNHIPQLNDFTLEKRIDFNRIEKKAFELIDQFAKVYEQLIPVVALKNGDCLDKIDKNEFGIMTANFDELYSFYANSYEWILDNLYLVLGFNNIFVRNDANMCANGKTWQNFIRESSKWNRLQNGYIDEHEPFSKPVKSLNNRVRNAIQHFDRDIDYETQLITFRDRNKEPVTLYLMDFADLCIDNFSLIFYMLELEYNLRKLDLSQNGIKMSFVPRV